MTALDDALAAFVAAAPHSRAETDALWSDWSSLIARSPDVLPGLYRAYLEAVRGLLDTPPPAKFGGKVGAFRFVLVFAASDYLPGFQQIKEAWRLLQSHHADHLTGC